MSAHEDVVLEFSRALVSGDFAAAHALLDTPLSGEFTAETLAARYGEMIGYGSGPAEMTQIVTSFTEWPDRRDGDLGWAYAAIMGADFSEAVAAVVPERKRIRRLEWGRP